MALISVILARLSWKKKTEPLEFSWRRGLEHLQTSSVRQHVLAWSRTKDYRIQIISSHTFKAQLEQCIDRAHVLERLGLLTSQDHALGLLTIYNSIQVDKLVYQLSVDLMRVIDAIKETIADVSSVSPSSERMRRANTRNISYCLFHSVYYPHQHSVDTPVCLPLCRCSYLVLLRAGITVFKLVWVWPFKSHFW